MTETTWTKLSRWEHPLGDHCHKSTIRMAMSVPSARPPPSATTLLSQVPTPLFSTWCTFIKPHPASSLPRTDSTYYTVFPPSTLLSSHPRPAPNLVMKLLLVAAAVLAMVGYASAQGAIGTNPINATFAPRWVLILACTKCPRGEVRPRRRLSAIRTCLQC